LTRALAIIAKERHVVFQGHGITLCTFVYEEPVAAQRIKETVSATSTASLAKSFHVLVITSLSSSHSTRHFPPKLHRFPYSVADES